MRSVMLVEVGRLELWEVPVPEPGPGEVLIRVMRASVCNGSDAALFSGRRDIAVAYPWMQLPYSIGHECAGEIVGLGPGVTDFETGQHVASIRYGGAFADYQLVELDSAPPIPVPDSLSYDEATFLEPMYTTNMYMPHIEKGDRVVLMGVGPSGILLLQQCLAVGAEAVLCADRHDLRLDIAARLGATATVNTEREDLERVTGELFGEADVCIDATGWDVYDIGIRLLRNGGKLIAYGVPDSGVHYDGTRAYFRNTRFITKSSPYATPPVEDTRGRIGRLLQRGRIDLRTFVTHHFPLEGVPEAVHMALEQPDKVLGMVIDVAQTAETQCLAVDTAGEP
jgi:L-iditol 2-dehydrogenase